MQGYRTKVASFGTQLSTAGWLLFGPMTWINSVLSAALMWFAMPVHEESFPSLQSILLGLPLMFILNDLALYWGHRVGMS